MIPAVFISGLFLFIYAWLQFHLTKAWQDHPEFIAPLDFIGDVPITVIIPARNEDKNIQSAISSVLIQDYPSQLVEVLVVDDHSADETVRLVNEINDQRVRLISLKKMNEGSRSGKKQALETAIHLAQNDWIFTMDADCRLAPDCLKSSVWTRGQMNAQIITGPVLFDREHGFLGRFQALDQTGMMLITGAGHSNGWFSLANGAHLAFSKKAFIEVGGYQGGEQYSSGDDMFLISKMKEQFPDQVGFLKNPAAVSYSEPEPTLKAFIQQRIRWATKNRALPNGHLLNLIWGFIGLYCVMTMISAFGILFYLETFLFAFLILFLGKSIVDYFLLRMSSKYFGQGYLLKGFLISEVLHILYVAIIGTISLFRKNYKWKGRNTR